MTIPARRSRERTDDPARAPRTSTIRRRVAQVADGVTRTKTDVVVVEEPLEIRLCPGDGAAHARIAVTMRTPGHDFELAAGFLFTEGILRNAHDVQSISYCTDPTLDGAQQYNIVNVVLRPGAAVDTAGAMRNFYTTSSCGVCGKASIDAIRVRGIAPIQSDDVTVDGEILGRLGEQLRAAQTVFAKTGGLHAAGLFDARGHLVALREDVGRHNAVDKLIGHAWLEHRLPLGRHILLVSGRASFEIAQKAAAGGIPILAAISAPSSLACDVAETFGMTLVGFVRGARFSVYTGAHRIRLDGGAHAAVV